MRSRSVAIAGLILAGGEGSRWGGPKAFAGLPIGCTFIEACAETMRLADLNPVVATAPPDLEDFGIEGLETISLPGPGLDMFASLRCGLTHLASDETWRAVVVLPVDHPLVAVGTVRLLGAARGNVIPSYRGKHGHPVRLTRALAERIVAGELPGPTLRDALRTASPTDLEVDDDPDVVTNCNTQQALESALHRRSTTKNSKLKTQN